jgi:geranylgeranyl pyrophosphate synthase
MKNPALVSRNPAVVDLLDRLVGARASEEDGALPGVPALLLEQALHGPARAFLGRPGKRFRARLVELAWAMAGGQPGAHPAELPELVEILHAGSLIIDDIEDGSATRRGEPTLHRTIGTPLAINTGNWLYFWPAYLLGRMGLPAVTENLLNRHLALTMLRCHEGQALDLSVKVCDLPRVHVGPTVEASTRLKTGSLMELSAAIGAVAAGAAPDTAFELARFGRRLGIGLQMLDDLGGILHDGRRHKGAEDLRQARLTWPWAWLAEEQDDVGYSQLRTGLVEVMGGAPADPLIRQLRTALEHVGRIRVKAALSGALEQLAAVIGGGEAVDAYLNAIGAEIERLEKSYG